MRDLVSILIQFFVRETLVGVNVDQGLDVRIHVGAAGQQPPNVVLHADIVPRDTG